jgi:Protein of unknown function (DUF1488)
MSGTPPRRRPILSVPFLICAYRAVEQQNPRGIRRSPSAQSAPGRVTQWCWCSRWTKLLNFPNQSRSYDATLRVVRFWGHDGAMEVSFFLNEEALRRIQPGARPDEAGLLSVFDTHRDLIHAAAAKAYRRSRKGSYELVPADF